MPLKPFLTPEFTSEEWQCRTLRTPNNKEWLGVFTSALQEMTNPYNWEQVEPSDLTIDEAIEIVQGILTEFYETELCCEPDACLLPDGSRLLRLGVGGYIEQLSNGAWIPPTGDYAIPPTAPREETTAIERRCYAATNAANVLKLTYEAASDAAVDGLTDAEVVAAMVAILIATVGAWTGLAVPALVAVAYALLRAFIEIAQFMTIDLWNSEFDTLLICLLFNCSTDTDDVVTFDLDCFNENYASSVDLTGIDALDQLRLFGQIWFMLSIIGADGLDAAGATTAVGSADCDACGGWCYQMLSSDGVEFVTLDIGAITAEDWILANATVGGQLMARFSVPLVADAQLNSVYFRIVNNGGFPRVTIMHNTTVWDGTNEIGTWIADAEPFHTFTGFTPVSGGYLGIQINANNPAETVMDDLILSSDILGAVNPFGEDNC